MNAALGALYDALGWLYAGSVIGAVALTLWTTRRDR